MKATLHTPRDGPGRYGSWTALPVTGVGRRAGRVWSLHSGGSAIAAVATVTVLALAAWVTPPATERTVERRVLDGHGPRQNTAPSIAMKAPLLPCLVIDETTIQWIDADPDDHALISLYYDTDAAGYDGTLIVTGLNESEAGTEGSYVWRVEGVPAGTYYVYGVVDDGQNIPDKDYADGTVTIVHPLNNATEFAARSGDDAQYGWAVVGWDMNGDGRKERVVSTPFDPLGGTEAGAVYVFPATAQGVQQPDQALLTLVGPVPGARLGYALATADLDDDNRDDLAISAPGIANGTGRVYVLRGGQSLSGQHPVANVSTLTIDGAQERELFGSSLAGVPDVTGDGVDDLVVGAPGHAFHCRDGGCVYLFDGRQPLPASLGAGSAYLSLLGTAPGDKLGYAVGGGGDFNADGKLDLVVGAPNATRQAKAGAGMVAVVTNATPARLAPLDTYGEPGTDAVKVFDSGTAVRPRDGNGTTFSTIGVIERSPAVRSALGSAGAYTACAWVRAETAPPSTGFTLFEPYDDLGNGPSVVFTNASTEVYVTRSGNRSQYHSTFVLEAGKWTHVGIAVDASGAPTLIVNNSVMPLQEIGVASLGAPTGGTSLVVGSDREMTRGFGGYVDEFAFFTTVRTSFPLDRTMNGVTGVVAYDPMAQPYLKYGPTSNDKLGAAVAMGDFVSGGGDEVAVGAPATERGEVQVLRPGDALLLDDGDLVALVQGPETNSLAGMAIAALPDLDGDRQQELAVGIPNWGLAGKPGRGGVALLTGAQLDGDVDIMLAEAVAFGPEEDTGLGSSLASIPDGVIAGGIYYRGSVYGDGRAWTFTWSPRDTEAPEVRVAGPLSTYKGGTLDLDASSSTDASGIAAYYWHFKDGGYTIAAGAHASLTFPNGGNFTVTVGAVDNAGNYGCATVVVNVSHEGPTDTTPPPAPVLHPLPALTRTPTVTVSGTAESGSTVTVTVDGRFAGNASASSGAFSFEVTLSEGEHQVSAYATDAAGNKGPPAASQTVRVDLTPPIPLTRTPAPGATDVPPDADVTVLFSEDVNASSLVVQVMGGGEVVPGTMVYDGLTRTLLYILPLLESGTAYTVTLMAQDTIGNVLTDQWSFTTAEEGVEVVGIVLDNRTSAPLEGATVEVLGEKKEYTLTTDEEGTFLIPVLPAGGYDVRVTLPGYRSLSATIEVGDAPLSLTYRLEPIIPTATITGEVRDDLGKPVQGATIYDDARILGTTGADGSYSVSIEVGNVPVKKTVNVTRIGYAPASQSRIMQAGQTYQMMFVLVRENTAPLLSSGTATKIGDRVNFTVVYHDLDGDEAASVVVVVDGRARNMTRGPGTAVAGITYYYVARLGSGSHWYYFTANDSRSDALTTDATPTTANNARTVSVPKADEGGWPWWAWLLLVLGILLLLALIGGGVFLFIWMRNRPVEPAQPAPTGPWNIKEEQRAAAPAHPTRQAEPAEPAPWRPPPEEETLPAPGPAPAPSPYQPTSPAPQSTPGRKLPRIVAPATGAAPAGRPAPRIERYTVESAVVCRVCGGTVKVGLEAIRCECGNSYHVKCAERVRSCPYCNVDLTGGTAEPQTVVLRPGRR